MTVKRALIVDDSKSARMFLSRILEKYEIGVETAESAELAIEHLATHRPDVIFMDHLMPGMDGFQAVQLIKNNPRTATIPIMMYTSQEGELYLGQARALGAVGVLPKQIRPADVSKVLYQLRLVPDRRTDEQETFRSVEELADADAADDALAFLERSDPQPGEHAAGIPPANEGDAGDSHSRALAVQVDARAPAAAELRKSVETAVHMQLVELRQFLTMSLAEQTARHASDLRTLLHELPRSTPAHGPARASVWPWAIASLAALAAAGFGVLWYREDLARRVAEGRLAQNIAAEAAAADLQIPEPVPPAPDSAVLEPSAGPADDEAIAPAATAANAPGAPPAVPAVAAMPAGVAKTSHAPALPRAVVEPVPYGEEPLAGARVEAVRAALARAVAQGFRGTVEIRTFAARYCLAGNSTEGYSVAPDDIPITKCDLLGNPREESANSGQRESLDFANFVGALRQSTANAVNVHVAAGDVSSVVAPYPPANDRTLAGEWNRAAAANNRIELLLRPSG